MNSKQVLLVTSLAYLMMCSNNLVAQHEEHTSAPEFLEFKHGISFVVGHTYISKGVRNDSDNWISAPSFGINYNFRLNEKWSIGLHNDIIIESFAVELTNRSETIERVFPISNILMSNYWITDSWAVAAGAGVEWERNEHFEMIRLGTEYAMGLKKSHLEVLFTLNYDILIDAFDTINFGIGLNRLF
ncbi:MAG: hypothetical protein V2I33_21015 [Kangiellaceae bacterium]|jgi:hypothetical protein|nr:hypothetical protein [Kangiellaceae bacterium]